MQVLTGEQRMGQVANATRELIETVKAAKELAAEPISTMLLDAADGDEEVARVLEVAGMRATFVQYAEETERILSRHPAKSLTRGERALLVEVQRFLHTLPMISGDLPRDGWPSPCVDVLHSCSTVLNHYAKCVHDYDSRKSGRKKKTRRSAKSA